MRAKTISKKEKENIKDFSKDKQLYYLTKPHSPQSIIFVEDKEDPWFIYVKYYKTKTGEVVDSSMIIAKDAEDWLTHLQHVGWKLKK